MTEEIDEDELASDAEAYEISKYSPQSRRRLEALGLFPKRVRLGPNRVAWVRAELYEWRAARIGGRFND